MRKKSVFIGISGIPVQMADALREQARANNRSVSGEIRTIIESALAEFSGASHDARQNTEQTKP
jgi:hypothetical protein